MISLDDKTLEEFKKYYESIKNSAEYTSVFTKENPLVSVCVATYNRKDYLVNRSILSILNQSYKNLEVIVIGDNCTDGTEEALKSMNDDRIKFKNRQVRGPYVGTGVAGTYPMNEAMEMATGDFVTHLDDDDEFSEDRIEKLLKIAQETKSDFIFHAFLHQIHGAWVENKLGLQGLEVCRVTTSSMFYHKLFKEIHWNALAFMEKEPGDWNRVRKIKALGPKITYCDEFLLKHYEEGQNRPWKGN